MSMLKRAGALVLAVVVSVPALAGVRGYDVVFVDLSAQKADPVRSGIQDYARGDAPGLAKRCWLARAGEGYEAVYFKIKPKGVSVEQVRLALRGDRAAQSKAVAAAASYKDDVINGFDGIVAYERQGRLAAVYGLGPGAQKIYKKTLAVGADGTVPVAAIDQAMCEVAEAFDAGFYP